MKFTLLLLLGFTVGAHASGTAQTVNLNMKNAKLENVLEEIARQTKLRFFYDQKNSKAPPSYQCLPEQ